MSGDKDTKKNDKSKRKAYNGPDRRRPGMGRVNRLMMAFRDMRHKLRRPM